MRAAITRYGGSLIAPANREVQRRLKSGEEVKLNLACFSVTHPAWINADVSPHLLLSRVPGLVSALARARLLNDRAIDAHRTGKFRDVVFLDVTRPFPLPENVADYVFISHLLHLLPLRDSRFALEEIHRVLRPGGLARVVVADLDRAVARYRPETPELLLTYFFPPRNNARPDWAFNATSLRALLLDIGFRTAVRRSYRDGACPDLDVLETRPKSLFMEAVK